MYLENEEEEGNEKESNEKKEQRIKTELDYCKRIAIDYRKAVFQYIYINIYIYEQGKIEDAERIEKEIESTKIKLYLYNEKKRQDKDKIHIDFDNPPAEMVELGKRYGFDLSDPETRKVFIYIYNYYMQLLNDIQNDSESSYDGKDESQNKSNSNVKRRFMNKEMNEIDEKQMFIPPDWGFKDIKSYLDNEGYDTKSMNEAQLRVYILNYL